MGISIAGAGARRYRVRHTGPDGRTLTVPAGRNGAGHGKPSASALRPVRRDVRREQPQGGQGRPLTRNVEDTAAARVVAVVALAGHP
jgi:hypothetical protein